MHGVGLAAGCVRLLATGGRRQDRAASDVLYCLPACLPAWLAHLGQLAVNLHRRSIIYHESCTAAERQQAGACQEEGGSAMHHGGGQPLWQRSAQHAASQIEQRDKTGGGCQADLPAGKAGSAHAR